MNSPRFGVIGNQKLAISQGLHKQGVICIASKFSKKLVKNNLMVEENFPVLF